MHEPETESSFYESYIERCGQSFEEDRLHRIRARIPQGAGRILDIGCGDGRNLQFLHQYFPGTQLYGTDIAHTAIDNVQALGFRGVQCDASKKIPYPDAYFDVIVCGEVIEHVVHTDKLLQECARTLRAGGKLLVTTPNLAYLPNRLLLLFGVQPIWTETSAHKNLGRGLKFLGQGRETQGHLKIFTGGALKELLRDVGFEVTHFEGYRAMQSGLLSYIDALLRIKPELAAGFVAEATKQNSTGRT